MFVFRPSAAPCHYYSGLSCLSCTLSAAILAASTASKYLILNNNNNGQASSIRQGPLFCLRLAAATCRLHLSVYYCLCSAHVSPSQSQVPPGVKLRRRPVLHVRLSTPPAALQQTANRRPAKEDSSLLLPLCLPEHVEMKRWRLKFEVLPCLVWSGRG